MLFEGYMGAPPTVLTRWAKAGAAKSVAARVKTTGVAKRIGISSVVGLG
jgi:hypothetical protein